MDVSISTLHDFVQSRTRVQRPLERLEHLEIRQRTGEVELSKSSFGQFDFDPNEPLRLPTDTSKK